MRFIKSWSTALALLVLSFAGAFPQNLTIDEEEQFFSEPFSVLAFHNEYYEGRRGAVELILHDHRIATNIDVRLEPIPIPDDYRIPIPSFVERKVFREKNEIQVLMKYPDLGFSYDITLKANGSELSLYLNIHGQVPDSVIGKLAFMMELYPGYYKGKTFIGENGSGVFPTQFNGPRLFSGNKNLQGMPIISSGKLSVAPDDRLHHFSIHSETGLLDLMDGRASTNHKWFIIRELIKPNIEKNAIVWKITPNIVKDWIPEPVVGFSQIGYASGQPKISVIEMGAGDNPDTMKLYKIGADGQNTLVLSAIPEVWGKHFRKKYARFDFSHVTGEGLYYLSYRDKKNEVFPIKKNLYQTGFWKPTLETFIPVQMCHIEVWDRMRVWHGYCHSDDALQAPPGLEHFDHYEMDKDVEIKFRPFEHIPGLNQGGWHDAGDNDIEGPSNTSAVYNLCQAYEAFGNKSDQTTVEYSAHQARLHEPDGKPDMLQQIEHGVRFILANYRAYGNFPRGVICPDWEQYLQMGDISAQTDGRIYNPNLAVGEKTATESWLGDDRLVFNVKNVMNEYRALNSLAIASRVLRGYDEDLAAECLQTALKIWDAENVPAENVNSGNRHSRYLQYFRKLSAVELYLCTGRKEFEKMAFEVPGDWRENLQKGKGMRGSQLVSLSRILEKGDKEFREYFMASLRLYMVEMDSLLNENPYHVLPLHTHFGTGFHYISVAGDHYLLHRKFPEIVTTDFIYSVLSYIHGNHPVTNHSLVNGLGTKSVMTSYGFNRADFSYIPGAITPGPLRIKPDLFEFRIDDPFAWVQKEYTIASGTAYVLLMMAAEEL